MLNRFMASVWTENLVSQVPKSLVINILCLNLKKSEIIAQCPYQSLHLRHSGPIKSIVFLSENSHTQLANSHFTGFARIFSKWKFMIYKIGVDIPDFLASQIEDFFVILIDLPQLKLGLSVQNNKLPLG
ncbi:hypothetical protein ACTXT7_003101 [Hymenolepis weldensis]